MQVIYAWKFLKVNWHSPISLFSFSKSKISTFKILLSFSMFIVFQLLIICILFSFICNIEPYIKANNKEMSMFLHWPEHILKLNSEQ